MTDLADIGAVEENAENEFIALDDVLDFGEETEGSQEPYRTEERMEPRQQVLSSPSIIDVEEGGPVPSTDFAKRLSPRPIVIKIV